MPERNVRWPVRLGLLQLALWLSVVGVRMLVATPAGATDVRQPRQVGMAGGAIVSERRDTASLAVVVPLVYSLLAAMSYLLLARQVRRRPDSPLDLAVTLRLQRLDRPGFARLMGWVSWLGFRPQSLVLPSTVISVCWLARRRSDALLLALAWTASLGSFTTKLLVRRPRPNHPLVHVVAASLRDSSFPSGHTIHYTAFWGFATYLAASAVPYRLVRWLVTAVGATLIALVGPSRIYLGHHWLSDVVGSYLLGSAWLSGLVSLHRLASRRRARSEDGVGTSGHVDP